MKRFISMVAIFTLALMVYSMTAWAGKMEKIKIDLIGIIAGAGGSGTVEIRVNPTGPDKLKLKVKGMPANTVMTVFLTFHRTPGGLPAQFLGEFKTDKKGKGKLKLVTEIVNAFASANPSLDGGDGEEPGGTDVDKIDKGALRFPLNWFRGYRAGGGNVFGTSDLTGGSARTFINAPGQPVP